MQPSTRAAKRRSPAKPLAVETTIPDGFDPRGPELYTWARTNEHVRLGEDIVDREFEAFRDKAVEKARRAVDWPAAFRTWLRKHREWHPEIPEPSSRPRRDPPRAPPPPRPEVLNSIVPPGATLADYMRVMGTGKPLVCTGKIEPVKPSPSPAAPEEKVG